MMSVKFFLWSSALLILNGKPSYTQEAYDSGGSSAGSASASSVSSSSSSSSSSASGAATSLSSSTSSSSSSSSASSTSGTSSTPWVPGGYPHPPGGNPAHNCLSPEVPICADLQEEDCCPDRCRCPFGYMRRKNDSKCIECNPSQTPSDEVQCPDNEIPICVDQQNLRDCCPDRCRCPFRYMRRTKDRKCVLYKPIQTPPDTAQCPENEIPICVDPQNLRDCCPDRCKCPFRFIRLESQAGKCVPKKQPIQPGQTTRQNEVAICANGDTDCCPDLCMCPEGFIRQSGKNGSCVKDCPENEIPVCADGDRDCCPEQCQCPPPSIRQISPDGTSRCIPKTSPGNIPGYRPNEVAICANGDTDCCPDRCICPSGFLRISVNNGSCVKDCPKNEKPVCANGDRDCCPEQCRCPPPFIRKAGVCLEKRRCQTGNPPNCPQNEVPICAIANRDCCPDRCRCPESFMRLTDDNGRCVKCSSQTPGDVDPPNCPPNEVPICIEGPGIPAGKYCCKDRCKCPGGFVRKDCDGECVPEKTIYEWH